MPDASGVILLPTVAGLLRGVQVRVVHRPGDSEPLFVLADVFRAVMPGQPPALYRTLALAMRARSIMRGTLPDGAHALGCRFVVISALEVLVAGGETDKPVIDEMQTIIERTPGLQPAWAGARLALAARDSR